MSRILRRARSLTRADWSLLARTLPVVVAARLALWIAGTRGARRAARAASRLAGAGDPERFPWAVALVSRVVPAASCLTQAVALQALFEAAGRSCRVEIGVARHGGFEAHAWVVCGNEIVLGAHDAVRFEHLTTLD